MEGYDNMLCIVSLRCLQGKLQADCFTLVNFLVIFVEVIRRWQNPATGSADGGGAYHNAVVLQKLEVLAEGSFHFFKACPPVIVVASH